MKNFKIGRATKNIKRGETMATVNFLTGEVKSDNIEFLPYAKGKVFYVAEMIQKADLERFHRRRQVTPNS